MTTDNQIRKGYFPDEIVPPFNTEDLADLLPTVLPKLATYATMKSKSLNLSIPKLKSFRRNLGICNPLQQIKLSKLIEGNLGGN